MKVDYLGILLIAIGFSCLEVVLDRGERLDWFESDFIVTFFVIAIVALVAEVRQQRARLRDVVLRQLQFSHELREEASARIVQGFGVPCVLRPANLPTRIYEE